MISIRNLRRAQPRRPWEVRVDRGKSVLGNPYFMENESQRDKVCDQYEEYFKSATEDGVSSSFQAELDRLVSLHKLYGKLTLFCWCSPKRCHGETIKRYLEERCQNNG